MNKNILILGAGKSGIAVAKKIAKDNNVTLTDTNPLNEKDKKILNDLNVKIIITNNQEELITKEIDLIIKNPAVKDVSPVIKKAKELNIEITNEMEIAYNLLPKNVYLIGITGSNGKTTTVTIVYEILKRMNKKVVLCGNIGTPFCDKIDEIKEGDTVLLEISDHQLCDFKNFHLNIAALTNIYPTHLDYHGSFENYKNIKGKIFNNQEEKDIAITNINNKDAIEVFNTKAQKYYFNGNSNDSLCYFKDGMIYVNNEEIIDTNSICLVGKHNIENILLALTILSFFKIDKKIINDFLNTFTGVEHRIEFVKEENGIKYYNDSKSTNPTSTVVALKTFSQPIHLILGGLNRNQDFNELNDYLKNVKYIYAIGEITDIVYEYAINHNINCKKCYNLENAIKEIKNNAKINEVVLLSPASSSQDQYTKFEERGKAFKDLI